MGYMHINNLYKDQLILLFKECYAMEKIHGTSANVTWDGADVKFHSGGESHSKFSELFNTDDLKAKFINGGFLNRKVVIYGEAYGGKCQKMSHVYGPVLKFVAFDVALDEANWLSVPNAEEFCKTMNIEFVHYVKIPTDIKEIDAQRDAFSVQAVRNNVTTPDEFMSGKGQMREGVVLRPLIDLVTSTGIRVISKHKGDQFRETASPRVIDDPNKLQVLNDATKIANEWVVVHRLEHILGKIPDHGLHKIPVIVNAMVEDVLREGAGEIVDSPAVQKAIKTKTVEIYKHYLHSNIAQQKS
jgi:hypothetical protein